MPVQEINLKLPFGKKIDTIDLKDWENFGMKMDLSQNKLQFDGYPTLFVQGVKVSNILSKEQLRAFLNGFFQKDKIVD